jgi:hypothetical protein
MINQIPEVNYRPTEDGKVHWEIHENNTKTQGREQTMELAIARVKQQLAKLGYNESYAYN